jgi:hypothetical protein
MKISKHEFIRTTHTIKLSHEKILDMFRAEGVEVDKLSPISIAAKGNKSVMINQFGTMRDSNQTLLISIVSSEERSD